MLPTPPSLGLKLQLGRGGGQFVVASLVEIVPGTVAQLGSLNGTKVSYPSDAARST